MMYDESTTLELVMNIGFDTVGNKYRKISNRRARLLDSGWGLFYLSHNIAVYSESKLILCGVTFMQISLSLLVICPLNLRDSLDAEVPVLIRPTIHEIFA